MVTRESWGAEADDLLAEYERGFAEWLPTTGAARVDSVTQAIGRLSRGRVVLSMSDGSTKTGDYPTSMPPQTGDHPPAQYPQT